ncbi:caspase family protein [Terasakiella sp. A23]|uniref:caspase family protein n=1 Tax=Terasakiella sp. FCG-A23 TaxID=3080561 RepID=UPI0029542B35|nr:caspase family protein [Terasakiella sp. A23]MDV7338347.1 caspase family protein [Terasakiella sp. A23]
MKTLHLLITGSLLWASAFGTAQSAWAKNDDVAIIIGNKVYDDQDIPEVSFALNDARAMKNYAKDVLNIRDENIIYLENATQAKMQSAFGRKGNHRGKAFQYVKPNVSNLYVFYSGHGLPGRYDDKSYLLPVDADIETADINGYPIDTLYQNLARVEAKSVTVFLDACFSGQSHGGTLITRASGAQILPSKTHVKEDSGLTVLTAASKDQLASWDEESKHGLFTAYLLRALYGEADKDENGQVNLAEVSTFLQEEMRYKARRTYNRDQIPTVIGDTEQVLAKAIDGSFPTRAKIDTPTVNINTDDYPLTPVEENMFAVKNANVRALPTVRSAKVDMLPKGEPIHVAAKVTDRPWYAIEKGNEIVGYVFADLLGEEKEIATEEENRAIRELKARLEKLEERTQLGDNDVLPTPPVRSSNDDTGGVLIGRGTDKTFKASDPYTKIENTLKSMGAILARQSFINNYKDTKGRTSFNYNWIRIDANQCSIAASISLEHKVPRSKRIDIHDHQVRASFWRELNRKKQTLRARDPQGDVVEKVTLYQYGPYAFKEKKDRRRFILNANKLQSLCPTPRQAYSGPSTTYQRSTPPPPPGRYDRRPPPPPPHHRR